jgi:hypothetical protein
LAECSLRIDRAIAAHNHDGMRFWTDALRSLRSGLGLRH